MIKVTKRKGTQPASKSSLCLKSNYMIAQNILKVNKKIGGVYG